MSSDMEVVVPVSGVDRDEWAVWLEAARREDVARELCDWQERLDKEIAGLPGRCGMSDRCCRFESYGHKLYVTAIEIAWVVNGLGRERVEALRGAAIVGVDECVFQVKGLCTARELRPLGCRVFLCDPAAAGWQDEVYERYLGELRGLHDKWGVAYRYLEWREGLVEMLGSVKGKSDSY